MDVRCDKCGTEYEFDDNRIGPQGVTVKCTACGFVFKVRRSSEIEARRPPPRASTNLGSGPQGREWLVRRPDGQMVAFKELTTLQKWIVEGRIGREEEISKNGETWKRLGNILELEPFFSVYEKAQTLNKLIDQGAMQAQPLELRGSELLAALNPLDNPAGPRYAIPSNSAIIQADSLPPRPAPPPLPPAPPPLRRTADLPRLEAQASELPSQRPSAAARLLESLDAQNAPPERIERPIDRDPVHATGLAGPGALDRHSPASFGSEDLDFPTRAKDDPVASFQREQRRARATWVIGGLVVAGMTAGVLIGLFGPNGNPIQVLGARYGLLEVPDDGSQKLLERALELNEQDSLAGQRQALALLAEAQALRPEDASILALRAQGAALLADSYLRRADDLEATANHAEALLTAHKALVEAAKTTGASVPVAPVASDSIALRAEAKSLRSQAQAPIQEAAQWFAQARLRIPGSFELARAEAALHLAQRARDPAMTALGTAKAALEQEQRNDALTFYLEAATLLVANVPADADLERATKLAEQATTLRPKLQRAWALLARIRWSKNDLVGTKSLVQQILAASPEHAEARALSELVALAEKKLALVAVTPPPPPPPPAVVDAPPPAEEQPKTFDYWMNQGDRLRERDRTQGALNAYGRAAELQPESAEPYVGKGWCFLDMANARLAQTNFERALKISPRFIEAHYGLAEAHRALGNKDAAIAAYERFIAEAPPSSADRREAQAQLDRLRGQ